MSEAEQTVSGLVTRSVGGICTVYVADDAVYSARPRGRIKNEGIRILPGDRVRLGVLSESEGVIEEVLERRSLMQRPYVANVDQVVAVVSVDEPPPSLDLLDRVLLLARWESLGTVIVWNKADRVQPSDIQQITAPYRAEGFDQVVTSCVTGVGHEALQERLAGRINVLVGTSGVGKSSLINQLVPDAQFEVGEVSSRLMRGRHTTRSVELVPLAGGGWLADAPGFSVLDLAELPSEELPRLYDAWTKECGPCRFHGCMHHNEPGCSVKAGVESGRIDAGRYRRYIQILEALALQEARRY